jgi:hypothetical protein
MQKHGSADAQCCSIMLTCHCAQKNGERHMLWQQLLEPCQGSTLLQPPVCCVLAPPPVSVAMKGGCDLRLIVHAALHANI